MIEIDTIWYVLLVTGAVVFTALVCSLVYWIAALGNKKK